MKSGRLGTPDTVAHIRQFPPVEYELASYRRAPLGGPDNKICGRVIEFHTRSDGRPTFHGFEHPSRM